MPRRRLECPECGSQNVRRHDDLHWECNVCHEPFTVSEVNEPKEK